MKRMSLTQAQYALVDNSLYEYINQWKWYANWQPSLKNYYAVRGVRKHNKILKVYMHRLIWEYSVGPIKDGIQIDHINNNPLDNRLKNLRLADSRLNQQNRLNRNLGMYSSKFVGVSWYYPSRKWSSHIYYNNSLYHLGLYDDELSAYNAYVIANNIIEKSISYDEISSKLSDVKRIFSPYVIHAKIRDN